MSGMEYNKVVSGGNAKLSFNNQFSFDNLIPNYQKTITTNNTTNTNISNSSLIKEDGTMELDLFLEDDIIKDYETSEITDSLGYDTTPKEEKGFWEGVGDWFASVGATVAVATTSIVSGVLDIGEAIVDGGAWVAAKAVGIFSEEGADAIEGFIATDLVSEANKAFYENTAVGKAINDASALKYDSELAQGIRSATEDIAVFAAATALTVCTGGAAAPALTLSLGAAYGLGDAAENTYAIHGTKTTVTQELMILGNGALSAASWYFSGKLGKGFVEIGKSMANASVKEILAEMCKGIFSKETLKDLFKPTNVVGNAISSLMQAGGDIGKIATRLYNGDEVKPEEWALLVGELVVYFGLNTAEDVLKDTVMDYGTPPVNPNTPPAPNAGNPKTIKEPPLIDDITLTEEPTTDTDAPQ